MLKRQNHIFICNKTNEPILEILLLMGSYAVSE